jgi:hypothetical protein
VILLAGPNAMLEIVVVAGLDVLLDERPHAHRRGVVLRSAVLRIDAHGRIARVAPRGVAECCRGTLEIGSQPVEEMQVAVEGLDPAIDHGCPPRDSGSARAAASLARTATCSTR